MEHEMKAKTPTKTRPPRSTAWFLDEIVHAYGPRVRVIALWRRIDGTNDWVYLARLSPGQAALDLIGHRFGGGDYRATLFGRWDPVRRREEYLEQVQFSLDDRAWRMTAETLECIANRRRM
jgi:hypothetical protein